MSDAIDPATDGAPGTSTIAEAASSSPVPPQPDVSDPAKLIRLGIMLQTVLAELHESATDSAGLVRLAQIHRETVEELQTILSDELQDELNEFNNCCGSDTPTEGELRVAHAQLVGWIQGLLHGMQATAAAQAAMAQQQMMMMQAQAQQRAIGAARGGPGQSGQPRPSGVNAPDSGYL
jgi:hypothetical protein